MKILMFTPFFHPHIGGVEKHVRRVSEELIKKGHEIIIITQKNDAKLRDYEKMGKIEVYRFKKIKMFDIWIWIFKHRKLIKNANIIHFHDYATFIYWFLPFRFFYPFKKIFITFHGYEGILPIPKMILLLRRISEYLTTGNICIGSFIPKWYGTKADFISFGGVDELEQKPSAENGSALYIGRLEQDTSVKEYIKAIKILKERNVNIKMNICGDGSLKNELKCYIKENDLNIKIHGNIDEIYPYLNNCSFTFLSGYLSILEAMISKKLVFSIYSNKLRKDYLTSLPNSREIMIITDSLNELTKEIFYYHQNPDEAEEKIQKAYKFAKKQTWQKLAEIYLELWARKNYNSY